MGDKADNNEDDLEEIEVEEQEVEEIEVEEDEEEEDADNISNQENNNQLNHKKIISEIPKNTTHKEILSPESKTSVNSSQTINVNKISPDNSNNNLNNENETKDQKKNNEIIVEINDEEPNDISQEITNKLLKIIDKGSWQDKKNGIEYLHDLIQKCDKKISPNGLNDLFELLTLKLTDLNKNLVRLLIPLLTEFIEALGNNIKNYSKIFVQPLLSNLSSESKIIRDYTITCIKKLIEVQNFEIVAVNFPHLLIQENNYMREEILKLIIENNIAITSNYPESFFDQLVKPLFFCLQDKNKNIRNLTENVIKTLKNIIPKNKYIKATNIFKPSIMEELNNTITNIYDGNIRKNKNETISSSKTNNKMRKFTSMKKKLKIKTDSPINQKDFKTLDNIVEKTTLNGQIKNKINNPKILFKKKGVDFLNSRAFKTNSNRQTFSPSKITNHSINKRLSLKNDNCRKKFFTQQTIINEVKNNNTIDNTNSLLNSSLKFLNNKTKENVLSNNRRKVMSVLSGNESYKNYFKKIENTKRSVKDIRKASLPTNFTENDNNIKKIFLKDFTIKKGIKGKRIEMDIKKNSLFLEKWSDDDIIKLKENCKNIFDPNYHKKIFSNDASDVITAISELNEILENPDYFDKIDDNLDLIIKIIYLNLSLNHSGSLIKVSFRFLEKIIYL